VATPGRAGLRRIAAAGTAWGRTGLGLRSESCSGWKKGLTGMPRLSARDGERERRVRGGLGWGSGWAVSGRQEREGEREAVGRAAKGEKKRGKEERKMGRPKRKKGGK
jgi:hypothetical protein